MRLVASFMISQEVFLEAKASYYTGLAGGFFTLKITIKIGIPKGIPIFIGGA